MSCGRQTPYVQKSVIAVTVTTAAGYEAVTDPIPCEGIDEFRAVIKVKSVTGNVQTRPIYRLFPVRVDAPNDWVEAGSWSDGDEDEDSMEVTVATAGAFFIQCGFAYASSSTGTADVGMQVAYDQCGEVVGNWQGVLQAFSSSNTFQPVTGWIPAIHATKVKMALISTGADSNFQYTVGFQKATYLPESPSAWDTTWDTAPTGAPYDGNEENNTGEMVEAWGTIGWVRFGIAYKISSGTFAQAYVSAATAIRNS